MKLEMYCVHDRQAQSFATPQFLIRAGQAVRSFSDEVNRAAPDNPLHLHPDDFDMYYVGSFDTDSGKLDVSDAPTVVALGKNVKLNGSA